MLFWLYWGKCSFVMMFGEEEQESMLVIDFCQSSWFWFWKYRGIDKQSLSTYVTRFSLFLYVWKIWEKPIICSWFGKIVEFSKAHIMTSNGGWWSHAIGRDAATEGQIHCCSWFHVLLCFITKTFGVLGPPLSIKLQYYFRVKNRQ